MPANISVRMFDPLCEIPKNLPKKPSLFFHKIKPHFHIFPSLTAVCVLVFTIPPFLRFFLIFPAFKLPRCSKYFMRSSVPADLQDLQPTVFSRYLALCPLRVFPAPDLAADFLPDASDKKFTHKIRHRKIPGEHYKRSRNMCGSLLDRSSSVTKTARIYI